MLIFTGFTLKSNSLTIGVRGVTNTKFFHMTVRDRQRRKIISRMDIEDEATLDIPQTIHDAANSYIFENLLTADFLPSFLELQDFIPNLVS